MLPKHRIFNLGIVATLALLFGILFVLSENVLKSSSMLNRRALGAMQNEDFKEAIAQIDSAIKINQDSPILYANKALFTASCTSVISDMSSFFSGQMIPDPSSRLLQEATILFAKASALSPRDPVFIHNLGWLKIAQGYFTEGKAYLQQALELAPYEPIYLISNGIVEESEGHNETATRLYTLAMISAPSLRDTPFYEELQVRNPEMSSRILQDGREELENKIQNERGVNITKSKLAWMYFYLGDTLIAKKLLEELTINYPGLNRSWLLFGNIMESEGDEIFAEVCYQKAFRLDPFDRQVLYTLGKYYDLHGDTTKVAVYFKRLQAIERFPRMTDYAIRTARIYQMQIFYNAYYPSLLQPYITASNPDIPERYIKEK